MCISVMLFFSVENTVRSQLRVVIYSFKFPHREWLTAVEERADGEHEQYCEDVVHHDEDHGD